MTVGNEQDLPAFFVALVDLVDICTASAYRPSPIRVLISSALSLYSYLSTAVSRRVYNGDWVAHYVQNVAITYF